jgi:hypothetical protein
MGSTVSNRVNVYFTWAQLPKLHDEAQRLSIRFSTLIQRIVDEHYAEKGQ